MATNAGNDGLPKRPTRDDVAMLAGVSSAVVSYVLNNGPRPVAAATRERVLDAVRQLDYVPNQIARSLAGSSTRTIGLIAPTLANPVWAELAMGITDVALPRSNLLMVCNVEGNADLDMHYASTLASKRVDGIIVVPTADPGLLLEAMGKAHIPVVVVERETPGVPSVVVDAVATGHVATEHLLNLGHKHVAFLREHRSGLDSWQRFDGYRAALTEADITFDPSLVADAGPNIDGKSIVEAGRTAANTLLDAERRPTAVFAHNDLIAIAVVQEARRRGLEVPADLSVIGVDDTEAGRYGDPALTTVAFPSRELGRAAAELLLGMATGQDQPVLTVISRGKVLVRDSTAPPPRRAPDHT
ncbi:MAG: LacI family transcriptional regulator [Actinomycetia bacterium]|nr:LacI family transcriptional regulator [Actinomycetes bacterium]